MNNLAKVNHEGWKLLVNYESVIVQKDGEHRIYDLDDIQDTMHEDEYVYLNRDNGSFYRVKFEDGNFLVIDEFDVDGEYVDSVGCHVFDEDGEYINHLK